MERISVHLVELICNRSNVEHQIGFGHIHILYLIHLSLMNMSRHIHSKWEDIILLGIILSPCNDINTYQAPLV